MSQSFTAGSVWVIYNNVVYPPKLKYHVCMCNGSFAVINTENRKIYQPTILLTRKSHAFLAHDSYLCLSKLFMFDATELREARFLGNLDEQIIDELLQIVEGSEVFTQEEITDILNEYTKSYK